MKLRQLLKDVTGHEEYGDIDIDIKSIQYDSRLISPGDLFVAIKGGTSDGHDYIDAAINKGAAAVVGENYLNDCGVPCVRVGNARKALAQLSGAYYGHPGRDLTMIGITGTNGKTTTAYLINSILTAGGLSTGILGTIDYRVGNEEFPANWTTPETSELHRLLSLMRKQNAEAVIMEISSHALDQFRVEGLVFRVALFTNLTQDHLDYHRSMENYEVAKQRLFKQVDSVQGESILNGDDPASKGMAKQNHRPAVFYSAEPGKSDIFPDSADFNLNGIKAVLNTPAGRIKVDSGMIGKHNIYNIMAASGAGISMKIPVDMIEKGIAELDCVPGRLEKVFAGQNFAVLVDYAHTPDAMEKTIDSIKPLVKGRLIVVFGCGGDRDRGKRPMMGRIAELGSDIPILTSDNPRTEDPQKIILDVLDGIENRDSIEYHIDRTKAIHSALDLAKDEDCVLILGKGHETYQVLGTEKVYYDDRKVAREFLKNKFMN